MEAKVTSPYTLGITEVVVVAFHVFLGSLPCLNTLSYLGFFSNSLNKWQVFSVLALFLKKVSEYLLFFHNILFFFSIQKDWAFSAYSNLVAWLNSGEDFLILSLKPSQTFPFVLRRVVGCVPPSG